MARQVKCPICNKKDEKEIMKYYKERYYHEECLSIKKNQELENTKVICKLCEDKHYKEEMIKKGSSYYHKECYEIIESRNELIRLFYKYTDSFEQKKNIYNAINIIKKKFDNRLDEKDLLFTMKYIIENKCKLNYFNGISYYIDKAMKSKKEKNKPQVKKFLRYVILTEDEYDKLVDDFGLKPTFKYIQKLDNYIHKTQKQYDSHYGLIKSWKEKDDAKEIVKPKKQIFS